MKHKAYAAPLERGAVGDRQVRVVASTADVDRAGEVVVQAGIDLAAYRTNPVVLFPHNPDQPVAHAVEIGLAADGCLEDLVQFPPPGTCARSGEVYGLVRAGVLNTVSIGFDPLEVVPMTPEDPRGPLRYLRSELLEVSFVSIPCNRDAVVVARHRAAARSKAAPPRGRVAKDAQNRGQRRRIVEALALG